MSSDELTHLEIILNNIKAQRHEIRRKFDQGQLSGDLTVILLGMNAHIENLAKWIKEIK